MNRKAFIYRTARLVILSVIAGLVVFLFKKGKVNDCEVSHLCSQCTGFSGCAKIQASKLKENEKE